MIGTAEIEDMLSEYAEALAAGDAEALVSEPVWSLWSALDRAEPDSRPMAEALPSFQG